MTVRLTDLPRHQRRAVVIDRVTRARHLHDEMQRLAEQIAEVTGLPADADAITDVIWNDTDLHAFLTDQGLATPEDTQCPASR